MNIILLTSVILGLILVGFLIVLYNYDDEVKIYSGPVPLGYDLEHFKKTGETILEDG